MTKRTETPDQALRRNVKRLKVEGLDAATDAAISLLRDPKATGAAKSATINAVFRAAGLFGKSADEDENLQPHEMTGEQLQRALARAMQQTDPADESDTGVFD